MRTEPRSRQTLLPRLPFSRQEAASANRGSHQQPACISSDSPTVIAIHDRWTKTDHDKPHRSTLVVAWTQVVATCTLTILIIMRGLAQLSEAFVGAIIRRQAAAIHQSIGRSALITALWALELPAQYMAGFASNAQAMRLPVLDCLLRAIISHPLSCVYRRACYRGPDWSMRSVAGLFGLTVSRIPLGIRRGYLVETSGVYAIFVAEHLDPDESVEVVGHELGHFLLRHELATPIDLALRQTSGSCALARQQEDHADYLGNVVAHSLQSDIGASAASLHG